MGWRNRSPERPPRTLCPGPREPEPSRSDVRVLLQPAAVGDDSRYPGTCREHPAIAGVATATRLLVEPGRVMFSDRIQGTYRQDIAAAVGDIILRRRDRVFAYVLAVVVDDAEQGVNHVLRGADLLDNTPRQIYLQERLQLASPLLRTRPRAHRTRWCQTGQIAAQRASCARFRAAAAPVGVFHARIGTPGLPGGRNSRASVGVGHRRLADRAGPKTPQPSRTRLKNMRKNVGLPWRCVALSFGGYVPGIGHAWPGTNRHLPAARRPTRARSI